MTAVTHELKCIKCKVVLRGIAINGHCPECGTLVMTSLVETLDMPSQKLARVRFPSRIAMGLGAFAVGLMIWSIATTAPPIGRALADIAGRATPLGAMEMPDRIAAVLALVGACIATMGGIWLARRDDKVLVSETGNAGRWLVGGLGIWLAATAILGLSTMFDFSTALHVAPAGIIYSCLGVELVGGAVASIGLRKFAIVLGRRCRRYRQAAQARQSIETLVLSAAICLVAAVASEVLSGMRYGWVEPQTLALGARVIAWMSGGMFLMGTIYLALNFWWICRIILAPPPVLESVIKVVRPVESGESNN